ncbi:MAG: hypothetical protein WC076_02720 [Terrimicrobiaceae bacterium]
MNGRCPNARQSAFSLVEIVLALGIFAFCIVVIIGLLGTVMNSSKESWMETRAAHIARQITDDLTPDPANTNSTTQATADMGLLMTPSVVQVPLFPANTYTNSAIYSDAGVPVETGATNALFKADIKIFPVTVDTNIGTIPARKLSQLQIDIRPVSQPSASPFRFVSRITPSMAEP